VFADCHGVGWLVGWFRVGDMKKLTDYIPMYIFILQINHFVL
jgi:hypothetical protein